jgi:DNA-binding CsgD family transcriptional regulator
VALATRAWVHAASRPPVDAAAELALAALADRRLPSSQEPIAFGAAVVALWASDRLPEAARACTEVVSTARATGALVTLRYGLALRAIILARMGQLPAADADVRELIDWAERLEISFSEYRAALPWLLTPLIDVLIERERTDEAEQWVALTDAEADFPGVHGTNYLLDALGRLRLAQGRVPEAIQRLRECGRRQDTWGIRNPGFMPWRSNLALALVAAGQQDDAIELCRHAVELGREFGVPRELGMAQRAFALIGNGGERVARLRGAVGTLERSPAALELARALADLGVALRERGVATESREPLRRALDLAVRCGATGIAARAHRELVASGAKPRRLAITGAGALTAAELRVARLAAEGLTNREIAQALYITQKTVEGHLAHAYRKLGISSRTQLRSQVQSTASD